MMRLKSVLTHLKVLARLLVLILVILSVASYVASMILGPVLFFSTSDGLTVASRTSSQIPLDLFMFLLVIPIPLSVSFGALFMAIWTLFVLCAIFAWRSRHGFLGTVLNALKQPLSIAKTNFLYLMPLIATSLLYASVLIQKFQETQGVQTGSLSFPPSTSPYVILINLAFAPLQEEFAFRITSIGVPLGILLVILYRNDERVSSLSNRVKLFLLAMFSPERAKAKVGYRNVGSNGFFGGISVLEWILILLTSAVFGLAHYWLGGGWQTGKISTAFLAGFVFGVMFVTYGAYASILLHWFFNYYFTVLDMADSTYHGLFHPLANGAEAMNLIVGQVVVVIFLVISAVKLADYLSSRAAGLTKKPE
jgi:membrane protease YdiL (CAAX protease family)